MGKSTCNRAKPIIAGRIRGGVTPDTRYVPRGDSSGSQRVGGAREVGSTGNDNAGANHDWGEVGGSSGISRRRDLAP